MKSSTVFCKKCGARLDKDKRCSDCGKKYFKLNKYNVLITILIFLVVLLACVLIITNIKHNKAVLNEAANNKKTTTTATAVKKPAENKKSDNSINMTEEEIRYILEAMEKNSNNGRSESKADTPDFSSTAPTITPNSSNINQPEKKTCAYPNCSLSPAYNSIYCNIHECSKAGCHNRRANDFCRYCLVHKCAIPDCNNGASFNSYYCYSHK